MKLVRGPGTSFPSPRRSRPLCRARGRARLFVYVHGREYAYEHVLSCSLDRHVAKDGLGKLSQDALLFAHESEELEAVRDSSGDSLCRTKTGSGSSARDLCKTKIGSGQSPGDLCGTKIGRGKTGEDLCRTKTGTGKSAGRRCMTKIGRRRLEEHFCKAIVGSCRSTECLCGAKLGRIEGAPPVCEQAAALCRTILGSFPPPQDLCVTKIGTGQLSPVLCEAIVGRSELAAARCGTKTGMARARVRRRARPVVRREREGGQALPSVIGCR
jgi:hypothetical protein